MVGRRAEQQPMTWGTPAASGTGGLGDGAGGVAAAGVVQPPGDDPGGVDANVGLGFVEGFGASADLDASWPPRRQHLVDDDRGAPGAGDVAELLGGGEAVPGDLDGLAVGPQRP